jgi:hypothetical protein
MSIEFISADLQGIPENAPRIFCPHFLPVFIKLSGMLPFVFYLGGPHAGAEKAECKN